MIVPRPLLSAAVRYGRALLDPARPMLAQLVVTRRCNLSCGYCNEYDSASAPVPTEILLDRVDRIGRLGTVVLTLTGGEPLLHPELDRVVARAVARGMVATSITNGYALTRHWVERLGRARLTALQLSIDNLEPNERSQKSWSKLRAPLELLRGAPFAVNVNAVLGACPPEETLAVAREVRAMGFYMTVGLLHDGRGRLDPGLAGAGLEALYHELHASSRKSLFHLQGEGWEPRMLRHRAADWHCRAGARYIYVDEGGLVSYCSQRRGEPGLPLESYGRDDLLRGGASEKPCAATCTLGCARRASAIDAWRPQPARVPVRLRRERV